MKKSARCLWRNKQDVGLNSEGELCREVLKRGEKQKIYKDSHKNSPLSCLLYEFLKFNANLLDYYTA